MRAAVLIVSAVVVVGCSGGADGTSTDSTDSSVVTTTPTVTATPPSDDDELFTVSDDGGSGTAGAPDTGADDEPDGSGDDDTVSTDDSSDGAPASTTGAGTSADATTSTATPTSGGDDGSTPTGTTPTQATTSGSADAGATSEPDSTATGNTDGGDDTEDGAGSQDEGAQAGSVEPVPVSVIDPAALLDADEVAALGLGDDWDIEVAVDDALIDGDAPCGFDQISLTEQLVADGSNQARDQLTQLIVQRSGPLLVPLIEAMATCGELLDEFGDDGRVIEVDTPFGSARGFEVNEPNGPYRLTYLGADLRGVAVLMFHAGPPERSPAFLAAFEALTADVAASL